MRSTDQEIAAIDKVLVAVPKRRRPAVSLRATGGSTWVSQAAEEMGKAEARAFTVVSTGRNR